MTGRTTDALGFIREVAPESRDIAGVAVPYGSVSGPTPIGPEAFAPGAFRDSVAHWQTRGDGARMAFRSAHGEKPIGTIQELSDGPDGVTFRATIFETPAGDEYLAQARAGLNGVSIEFAPGDKPARLRSGVTLHRQATLHAIAGSVSPAYDGARIALRDMEEPTVTDAAEAPTPDAAVAPQIDNTERAALEARDVAARIAPATITITRPEFVYSRGSEHNYLQDAYLQTRGDTGAADRVQKHQGILQAIAVQEERAAWDRFMGQDVQVQERAGDVLSSEIPGAYPTDFVPGLLTPRILKGRPMGSFYNRVPIADARPRTFPKVTTSTTVAVQSAEGAALSATDLATTAVTVTPLMYGAYTDVSRQALDGADPSVLAMIYQDLIEAYAQASETVIKTAVEAGSTASGVAITAATPYAGVVANVVNYYATRFRAATGAFIPSAEYSVLLAQADTTGRPLLPQIGAVNSDGTVDDGAVAVRILSAQGRLSYASTVNVNVFGIPSDFVIFESSIAQFQYDQVVGPQAVRVGLYAYLVVGTRLGSLKVTAA